MAGKFALLIGNSIFEDAALSQLAAPESDVEALRQVLLDSDIGSFDRAEILLNANLQGVRQAVHDLFSDAATDDLILLYYAGHGILDFHNQLYLALGDSSLESPAVASLEASYIRERMRQSPSQRQVIILDCCHSGAFMEGRSASVGTAALTGGTFEAVGSGRYVLAACTQTQFAFEKGNLVEGSLAETQPAVFTRALVEGLRTGLGGTKDDSLTIGGLFAFARDRVRQLDSRMTPKLWTEDAEDLILARNPRWSPPLDESALQALEQGDKMARLGAVSVLARYLKGDNPSQADEALEVLRSHLRVEDSVSVREAIAANLEGAVGGKENQEHDEKKPVAVDQTSRPQQTMRAWKQDDSFGIFALLPFLWLLGLGYSSGPYYLSFTAFYLPIAAWLGAYHGRSGFRVFAIGALPLLVGFGFAGFTTWGDPGFYVACLIICRVFGQEGYRIGILNAAAIKQRSLLFLFVALGTRLNYVENFGDLDIDLGTYFVNYFYVLVFLIGMSSIPLRTIAIVLLVAATIGLGLDLIAPMPRFSGIRIDYVIDDPGKVLTSLVLLYCGRLARVRLIHDVSLDNAMALQSANTGLAWPQSVPTLLQLATVLLISLLLTGLNFGIDFDYARASWKMMSPIASIALLFTLGFLYGRTGMLVACGVWTFTNILLPSSLVMTDPFFFADFRGSMFGDSLNLDLVAPSYFSAPTYGVAPAFPLSVTDPLFAVFGWATGRAVVTHHVASNPDHELPSLGFRKMDVIWTVVASIGLLLAAMTGFANWVYLLNAAGSPS